jgi:hypothetical protein
MRIVNLEVFGHIVTNWARLFQVIQDLGMYLRSVPGSLFTFLKWLIGHLHKQKSKCEFHAMSLFYILHNMLVCFNRTFILLEVQLELGTANYIYTHMYCMYGGTR